MAMAKAMVMVMVMGSDKAKGTGSVLFSKRVELFEKKNFDPLIFFFTLTLFLRFFKIRILF